MKRAEKMILLGLFIFFLPLTSTAGDFDGSKPLLCAVIEEFDCTPAEECLSGPPQNINIPQFLRIDFGEKVITGAGGDGKIRSTTVNHMTHVEGKLILQGIQEGKAWSMVITETTGKMTLTAADDQVGFLLFGACTVP